MAEKNRNDLKSYFNAGDRPTETEFADLIDSFVNRLDDDFVESLPSANTSTPGIVRRSTAVEVANGANVNAYVTPSNTVSAIEDRSPGLAPVQSVNNMTGNVIIPEPQEVYAIINSNGSVKAQSGSIQITSQRNSVGNYSISFVSPLSNNNYFIGLTNKESIVNRDDIIAKYDNNTTTGFDVWIGEQDNGGTEGIYKDREFMIHVRGL